MAHFSQLNDSNIVIKVIVVSNSVIDNLSFPESESIGIDFCKSLYGNNTIWKQTSYNGTFRKNFAGIGFLYDETRDAFIPQKPYNSWILNENTCVWEAPTPCPNDGNIHTWDEETVSWVIVDLIQTSGA